MKIFALVYIFIFYYKKLHMLFGYDIMKKITSLIEYYNSIQREFANKRT